MRDLDGSPVAGSVENGEGEYRMDVSSGVNEILSDTGVVGVPRDGDSSSSCRLFTPFSDG